MRPILLALCAVWLWAGAVCGQDIADSLTALDSTTHVTPIFDSIYVIPAGPVAGSFTPQSRIQVVDTVAGWARILVEGWVPVEKVVGRMTSEIPQTILADTEKPKKVKKERPQCTATTTKGKRCTRKAISGSNKCWQHSQ
ncbi:MAG: hypothetical protein IPG71_01975 [bacterium]|nr:hypothetical protein [bacterium]